MMGQNGENQRKIAKPKKRNRDVKQNAKRRKNDGQSAFAACGKDDPNCLYLKMGALLDSCIDFFSKACYNKENGGLDDEFM